MSGAAALEAPPALSDAELNAIAELVYERCGITLHDGKRALITARLQKRLKTGGFRSFSAYIRFVKEDASGQELVALLDAIATNHTSFFREPQHFAFLRDRTVPEWQAGAGGRPFEIWSAACATGEEPYSIVMTLLEALPAADHGRIRVLASDLSTKALGAARAGVYRLDRVQEVPAPLLRKHFERGIGEQEGLARVRSHLRAAVTFEQRNLLEGAPPGRLFEIIFCRNVMIYFDRAVQQRVVSMLERRIAPGGYLCISHSEGLNGVSHGLQWVAPAIYRRPAS